MAYCAGGRMLVLTWTDDLTANGRSQFSDCAGFTWNAEPCARRNRRSPPTRL